MEPRTNPLGPIETDSPMRRSPREFRAESFELEGRLLLTTVQASHHVRSQEVRFLSTTQVTPPAGSPNNPPPVQVVGQQDGQAVVTLSRFGSIGPGRMQVRVTTDPSSPAVGVNVGAVDQTVTFANHKKNATVTVPLLSGASNPGEVDVNLIITPVSPNVAIEAPLELRILASDATLPPKILSTWGKSQSIVLTFNKPMNPVGASNVNNYVVQTKKAVLATNKFLVPIDILTLPLLPLGGATSISTSSSQSTQTVPLRAANYDPATNSVTLVLKRRLTYSVGTEIVVSQGHLATTSVGPGPQSNLGQGLTDLEGNPIEVDSQPGRSLADVHRGFQPTT